MRGGNRIRYRRNRRKNKFILLAILIVLMLVIAAILLKLVFFTETASSEDGKPGGKVASGEGQGDTDRPDEGNPDGNNSDGSNPDGDNLSGGSPDESASGENNSDEDNPDEAETADTLAQEAAQKQLAELIGKADRIAKGYDYDAAIDLLATTEDYEGNTQITERIKEFEAQKAALVEWEDVTKISHVFFHSLVVDTGKAFDGDEDSGDYNTVMTTADEFNKIMEQMYERGYVLVRIHDMADFVTGDDGSVKFTKGKIMLPEGKIPFILSQDDVNYYKYMEGDGFASRLVIGEDGMVTTEMDLEDGTSVQGSYDVVPLLEDFIEEHPDFSYRGARGILGITGYQGVFGYRTSRRSNAENPNIEEDTKKATEVANRLKEMGWELASHSWGHRHMGQIPYKNFTWDTDIWETEVKPILGDTDIYIYPYGDDIGSWKPYKGEKYDYLKSKGFVYFCNVDAAGPYWVQITDEYLRQGRINLDGMRMYEAISGGKNRVEPFFDVETVFDKARPLPVPGI